MGRKDNDLGLSHHGREATMAERQFGRVGILAGALGLLGIATACGVFWTFQAGRNRPKEAEGGRTARAVESSTPIGPDATLDRLAQGVKRGDGMALAVLQQRLAVPEGQAPRAIPTAESPRWLDVLSNLRSGFPKYSGYGRASVVAVSTLILDRYAIEPAPADWLSALGPVHDILVAALADADVGVRVQALKQIGRLWVWSPGRDDLYSVGLDHLANWKASFHELVVRALGDQDAKARAAAVICLAALPLDDKAAPALAYLNDPDPEVRLQVLAGFAKRDALLNEEAILPLLYDPAPAVAPVAERVLKARGLNEEQIGLGKLIVHPQPHLRISAIPMLLSRSDIDPVVWLLYLSRDKDASVRAKAVEALAGRDTPESRRRLAEMAHSDPSPEVREAAAKVAPRGESTAALPPLPGSPSLNPKAN